MDQPTPINPWFIVLYYAHEEPFFYTSEPKNPSFGYTADPTEAFIFKRLIDATRVVEDGNMIIAIWNVDQLKEYGRDPSEWQENPDQAS